MKLLLDENLSDKVVPRVADLFPGSTHVKAIGLAQADDRRIWEWAKRQRFAIISKDTDFHHQSIAFGHPPKFIWLRVGNLPTLGIINLLRAHSDVILAFGESATESLLVLEHGR